MPHLSRVWRPATGIGHQYVDTYRASVHISVRILDCRTCFIGSLPDLRDEVKLVTDHVSNRELTLPMKFDLLEP